jgi:hypothetical protein
VSCRKAEKKFLNLDGKLLFKIWVLAGLVEVEDVVEDVVSDGLPPSISLMKASIPPRLPLKTRLKLVLSVGEPFAVHATHTGRMNTRSMNIACCPFDSPVIFYSPLSKHRLCLDMLKSIR